MLTQPNQKPVVFQYDDSRIAIFPMNAFGVSVMKEVTQTRTDASKSVLEQPATRKACILFLPYSISMTVVGDLESNCAKLGFLELDGV